jgi:hypothetical protein
MVRLLQVVVLYAFRREFRHYFKEFNTSSRLLPAISLEVNATVIQTPAIELLKGGWLATGILFQQQLLGGPTIFLQRASFEQNASTASSMTTRSREVRATLASAV